MKIVTLCGSLKFQNEMMKIAQDMALEGYCIHPCLFNIKRY